MNREILGRQGTMHDQERQYNLSQQPMAFADNTVASAFLKRSGEKELPLMLLDGEIMLAGRYPERSELKRWCGITNNPDAPGRE